MFWKKGKNIKVGTDSKKIEEFLTRGVENIYPSKAFLESELKKGKQLTFYLGIDPTGPTLHLGHVIPLRKLAQLQKLGHQIIMLIGDFTAMIGDPTDKSAVRKKLTREEVFKNLREYKKQAGRYIDFSGSNKAIVKHNSQWLSKMNFAEVLELASSMTVQQMLERDMFAKRIQDGSPLYIHEFLYPLMQGYDSVAMDVDGEIGGNDQTFNMLAGRNLLKSLKNKEKFVMTTKLLTDVSGKKMGKTENNMVALDQSADEMFGRVMSWSDELIVPGFELVTDVSPQEIESIKSSIISGENPKIHKVHLAKEIVSLYHGKESAEKAEQNFEKTFSKKEAPQDVLKIHVSDSIKISDKLVELKIVESKTDLRRLVDVGAVSSVVSGKKIESLDELENPDVLKIGKHRFVEIVNK